MIKKKSGISVRELISHTHTRTHTHSLTHTHAHTNTHTHTHSHTHTHTLTHTHTHTNTHTHTKHRRVINGRNFSPMSSEPRKKHHMCPSFTRRALIIYKHTFCRRVELGIANKSPWIVLSRSDNGAMEGAIGCSMMVQYSQLL